MRRSRKQESWKRTAIKTATDSFRRIFIWLSLGFAPRSVLFSNIQWLFDGCCRCNKMENKHLQLHKF
jgi:hypothetical protein